VAKPFPKIAICFVKTATVGKAIFRKPDFGKSWKAP